MWFFCGCLCDRAGWLHALVPSPAPWYPSLQFLTGDTHRPSWGCHGGKSWRSIRTQPMPCLLPAPSARPLRKETCSCSSGNSPALGASGARVCGEFWRLLPFPDVSQLPTPPWCSPLLGSFMLKAPVFEDQNCIPSLSFITPGDYCPISFQVFQDKMGRVSLFLRLCVHLATLTLGGSRWDSCSQRAPC